MAISASATQGIDQESDKAARMEQVRARLGPVCSGCEAEIAAYAAILVQIEILNEDAEEAWQAWYDCDYANGGGGGGSAVPDHSVLIRD